MKSSTDRCTASTFSGNDSDSTNNHDADDKESTVPSSIKGFVVRSIRHHVAHSQQPGAPLHEDALLMRVLGHDESVICARAVSGLGIGRLTVEIKSCEANGRWLEAALEISCRQSAISQPLDPLE